jgi:phosphoribosyl-ATP pyrophosphohydrolase/phosphoribosyl-AMP cyclohydrolase
MAFDITWDEHGLVPTVAVDAVSGRVLRVGWMDAETLDATVATGEATFHAGAPGGPSKKSETSGAVLRVTEVRLGCDRDSVLLIVDPAGPACKTGKPSCFFRRLEGGALVEDEGPRGAPAAVIDRVASVIEARRASTATRSYTRSLLDAGMVKILAKIAEEHGELAAELPAGPEAKIVHETADLLFHVLVGLAARDVPAAKVWAELERRFGVSGHEEKAARGRGGQ